jgi:putative peptide zinc metalloprotease protein
MDGKRTLDQAQKEFEKRFRPERLTLEDLEGFAQQLLQVGLAQNEAPQAGKQLYERRKKRRRSEFLQYITNILYVKIPLFDPDKLLARMLRFSVLGIKPFQLIFTTGFALLSLIVMLGAILLVATNFDVFRDKLPSYEAFFSFSTVMNLWIALGVVKVIHEFGHGLSCKAFGGEVHEMGLLFLVFSPCLYCNVSDAWTLPSKWKRIIISAAGIWVELIIAAIATFVWWNTPANPWLNNMALALMIVCSISTVIFNANPLMRYDGYYVLADWLEIPNLRDRSNKFLKHLVLEHCLGVEVQPEPYMRLGRKIGFVFYAIVSYIYRWVITFWILIWMSQFLEPYRLKVVSQMLALAAVASMIGWPLYRLGKNIHKRGRLPDMKPARVTVSVCILLAVVLCFFLVPLPVSRVREKSLVELPAGSFEELPVPIVMIDRQEAPVFLDKLEVHDGQHVTQGQVLATFRNDDLEAKIEALRGEHKSCLDQIIYLRDVDRQTALSPKDKSELVDRRTELNGRCAQLEGMIALCRDMKENLELKAPRSGVVMSPPRRDEVGKQWDRSQHPFFCRIGDIGAQRRVQVKMPVSPIDRDTIWKDTKGMTNPDAVEVLVRVQGMDARVWRGKLIRLQDATADTVPEQLTAKGGGNIAVKPGSRPGAYKPQSQQFFAYIEIQDAEEIICPGTMAQVRINCEWRSCAWWVWRWATDAFNLKLL